MKLTDGLLGEHTVFYAQFDHLEQALPAAESVAEIRTQSGMLAAALAAHANLEEELLFKSLDSFPNAAGPLNVMCMEHQEIESTLEQILFRLAHELLGDTALIELGSKWAEQRKVMI